MGSPHKSAKTGSFDPNRLLDNLITKMHIHDDDELAQVLHVQALVIRDIRTCATPIWGSLLIQMSEAAHIDVSELRSMMGDKRKRVRLTCTKKT